jgi:hypothetical protein
MKGSTNSEERKHHKNEIMGEQISSRMLRNIPCTVHGILVSHTGKGFFNSLITIESHRICGGSPYKTYM